MRREGAAAELAPDVAAARFDDWGGYLQLNWGYKAGQVVGLRVDRVGGDLGDPEDSGLSSRLRISPVLTWFPTEYSKLRLQYNFDQGDALERDEHSIWLQLEFLLGAHAARNRGLNPASSCPSRPGVNKSTRSCWPRTLNEVVAWRGSS